MLFPVPLSLAAVGAPTELLPWVVAVAIIFVGLVLYGGADLVRTNWVRIWAISGVCQTESLRKGVLWVTPLAIIGVVVVSQFQHPMEPQDSIRQITKFCLFASGMLVTITAVIMASASLPREIENRVIFTIVTKPTTRLEIILGKVVGFARVSGLIILIMGVFTLLYLELRTRPMISDLKTQIASLEPTSPLLATDRYYVESGLLGTRSLEWAENVQFFSRTPTKDPERWMSGGIAMYFVVQFELSPIEKEILGAAAQSNLPVDLNIAVDLDQHVPTKQQLEQAEQMGLIDHGPKVKETLGPKLPTTAPATAPAKKPDRLIPQIAARFLDQSQRPLSGMNDARDAGVSINLVGEPGHPYTGSVKVDNQILIKAVEVGRFIAQVNGRTPSMEFGVMPRPIWFSFMWPRTAEGVFIRPSELDKYPANSWHLAPFRIDVGKDHVDPTQFTSPLFFAYPSRHGMRLPPATSPTGGPMAVFAFENVPVNPGRDGKVGLQVGAVIERMADSMDDKGNPVGYASASVEVRNHATGETSGLITFSPEISRSKPVSVDAHYFEGGNFEVILRNTTPNQSLAIEAGAGGALAVVTADRSFAFNLAKSLFILWLLSILVISIAIFCSTRVSWPIAVVATLLILLTHWGVDQLGDSLKPGGGRSIATGFGFRDPAATNAFSVVIDLLSSLVLHISKLMPDVTKFAVTEDIERGVSIPPSKVKDALSVVFCFGAPMVVLSYVLLRRKEVAP